VQFDLRRVAETLNRAALETRPRSHWRYYELLPVDNEWIRDHANTSALGTVGWTPMIEAPRLALALGIRRLRLKDDGRNPSGSFKDRPSSLAVGLAMCHLTRSALNPPPYAPVWRYRPEKDLGKIAERLDDWAAEASGGIAPPRGSSAIACASTGNAASSLACAAASMGMVCYIFVSKICPDGKLAQLLAYGATVFKVMDTYAAAYELCNQACARFGWYNRNCAINPYLVEGKKTGGLEVAEQCADDPPDWVAASVGDGCSIAGIHKGLVEMKTIGVIDWSAKLLGVQAAGVAPVVEVWHRFETGGTGGKVTGYKPVPQQGDTGWKPVPQQDSGSKPVPQRDTGWKPVPHKQGTTYADSINCPVPRNLRKAVNAVRDSGGAYVAVADEQIMEAVRVTGRLTGVFAEPAAAATVAGVAEARRRGSIGADADVVAMITGNGLKDVVGAMKAVGKAHEIAADLGAVERVVNSE